MPHGYRSTALSIYLFACGAAGVHRLAPATSVTFRNATIDRPISQPFVRNDLGPAWFFPSRTRCINYVLSFTCLSTQLLVLAIKWTIYFSGRWNSHRDMLVEFDPRGVAGIAVDASGSVYFADNYTNRTRKGLLGGNHHHDFRERSAPHISGRGDRDANAQLEPYSIVLDAAGNFYVADQSNDRARRIVSNRR